VSEPSTEILSWLQPHKLLIALLWVFMERRSAPYLSFIILVFSGVLLSSNITSRLQLNAEVQQHHDEIALAFLFCLIALPVQIVFRFRYWRAYRFQRSQGWTL